MSQTEFFDNWMANIVEYEPLARHTSWAVGGPARFFVSVRSAESLKQGLYWWESQRESQQESQSLPILLLGGGTNLLFPDDGFPGLVIKYRGRAWRIEPEDDHRALLIAEAGMPISKLAWEVGKEGWGGLEWAAGLPGTVGGAVYGNAGCYGGDIATIFERAWLLVDQGGQTITEEWPRDRMAYGYRSSSLKMEHAHSAASRHRPIITAVALWLERRPSETPETLIERMHEIMAQRKAKTPVGRSCGSVFRNPTNPTGSAHSAGQLIEQAGLKGQRIGGAEVSQHHANYIMNRGDATSDDILRLIDLIRERVAHYHGVTLTLEVEVVDLKRGQ